MVSEQSDRGYPLFFSELKRDACVLWEHRGVRDVDVHSHEFLELSYILNGSVEHTLDGTTEILRAGDYLIVDYGSCHSYVGSDGGRFDNIDCLFLPALLDPALEGTKSLRAVLEHYLLHFNMKTLAQNPARMIFHDGDGRVLHLIERIGEELRRREAGFAELIRCYLVEILLLTMRRIDGVQSAAIGNEISAYLTAYVEEHYAEPLTLDSLAEQFFVSRSKLSKDFKTHTGTSLHQFLLDIRINRAILHIYYGTYDTVREIAEAVGFGNSLHFYSAFKKAVGMTPLQYAKKRNIHMKALDHKTK